MSWSSNSDLREIFHPCWSDEEYGEKSVSVKVDDEEVELCFIDHPSNEMSVGDKRQSLGLK